jgi:hypothetical protein
MYVMMRVSVHAAASGCAGPMYESSAGWRQLPNGGIDVVGLFVSNGLVDGEEEIAKSL